jgi:hypothetical protein
MKTCTTTLKGQDRNELNHDVPMFYHTANRTPYSKSVFDKVPRYLLYPQAAANKQGKSHSQLISQQSLQSRHNIVLYNRRLKMDQKVF